MPTFTPTDEQVFALAGRTAIQTPGNLVGVDSIVDEAQAQHLVREDIIRSLRFLEENGLITIGGRDSYVQFTGLGVERWARANLDYEALQDQLGRAIVAADGRTASRLLGQEVDAPDIVIRHIIRTWGNANQLTVGRAVMAAGEVLPVTGMTETFRRRYGN